ncbi:MAG: MoaD/ThiS family protein [Firmicutes bacterium]|nr:MoaD/ThiS family protein [Bacillota bacterium]
MVKVKFFGVLRLETKIASVEVEAKTVKKAYEAVEADLKAKGIENAPTAKDLKDYITFVNGINIYKLKRQATKLKAGDEIVLMSPVSGG